MTIAVVIALVGAGAAWFAWQGNDAGLSGGAIPAASTTPDPLYDPALMPVPSALVTPGSTMTLTPTPRSIPSRSAAASPSRTTAPPPRAVVTLTNPADQTSVVGTPVSLQLRARDTRSGARLTYSASGLPTGLSINASTGLISGTPTTAVTRSVNLSAADNFGASDRTSIIWTVKPPPPVCGAGQKLGNPGFESGSASPWTATPEVIDNSTTPAAHSGSWKAWLGGYGTTATSRISQSVAVPGDCSSHTLRYWLSISTAETGGVFDTLVLRVRDSGGSVLATLATHTNTDAGGGYREHVFDLDAYTGQAITIEFTATEDYSLQTSFILDDITLDVS